MLMPASIGADRISTIDERAKSTTMTVARSKAMSDKPTDSMMKLKTKVERDVPKTL